MYSTSPDSNLQTLQNLWTSSANRHLTFPCSRHACLMSPAQFHHKQLTGTEYKVGNKCWGVKLRSEMVVAASLWREQCVHTLTPPSALLSTHRALKAYLGGTLVADWAQRVIAGAKLTPSATPRRQLDGQLRPINATEILDRWVGWTLSGPLHFSLLIKIKI